MVVRCLQWRKDVERLLWWIYSSRLRRLIVDLSWNHVILGAILMLTSVGSKAKTVLLAGLCIALVSCGGSVTSVRTAAPVTTAPPVRIEKDQPPTGVGTIDKNGQLNRDQTNTNAPSLLASQFRSLIEPTLPAGAIVHNSAEDVNADGERIVFLVYSAGDESTVVGLVINPLDRDDKQTRTEWPNKTGVFVSQIRQNGAMAFVQANRPERSNGKIGETKSKELAQKVLDKAAKEIMKLAESAPPVKQPRMNGSP